MSPRVLKDSLHPRLQSGACARPLRFTVRDLPCDDRPALLRAVDARAEPCGNGGRRWAQAPFFHDKSQALTAKGVDACVLPLLPSWPCRFVLRRAVSHKSRDAGRLFRSAFVASAGIFCRLLWIGGACYQKGDTGCGRESENS